MTVFEAIFGDAMREALKQEANTPKLLNPWQYKTMQRVYDVFEDVFGDNAKIGIELRPMFNSGTVSVILKDTEIDKDGLYELTEVLQSCNTLDAIVRYDDINISVTIPDLFKKV